jgi:hypothetical protein
MDFEGVTGVYILIGIVLVIGIILYWIAKKID